MSFEKTFFARDLGERTPLDTTATKKESSLYVLDVIHSFLTKLINSRLAD